MSLASNCAREFLLERGESLLKTNEVDLERCARLSSSCIRLDTLVHLLLPANCQSGFPGVYHRNWREEIPVLDSYGATAKFAQAAKIFNYSVKEIGASLFLEKVGRNLSLYIAAFLPEPFCCRMQRHFEMAFGSIANHLRER